jgi:hypothetical protein
MLAQFRAQLAAVGSARGRPSRFHVRTFVAMAAAASLGGCLPATAPLTGADPASPSAKVARVAYRSTIAPYTPMRPSAPAPWRERNDSVAPSPRPDR